MSRVTRGHHILGVEHLLCELRNCQRAVLLRASRRQRCEAGHEEVQARKRNLYQFLDRFPLLILTMLTASFRRSAFSWPGKRRQVVTPDIVTETR